MKTEMLMPQMGESIAEATILKWYKKVGDEVAKDETLLEISTDKVDSEIPAPASGVIVELKAKEGDTVAVKSVIAIIDSEKSAAAPSAPQAAPQAPAPQAPASQAAAPQNVTPQASSSAGDIPSHMGDKFFSPLVRNVASQHNLSPNDLAQIPGSGAHGRVTKSDVVNYVQHRESAPASAAPAIQNTVYSTTPVAASGAPAVAGQQSIQYGPDGVRVEQMDRMRQLIADHMVRSKATSPHVYTVAEVDVTNIAKWRQEKQKAFLAREGFKLSFTPFFLEATVKALVAFPYVNASVDGTNIVLKKHVHLGCAVALGTTGLIVPVIKNADRLSLAGIAQSLQDIAQRARSKKLMPDETSGGTFTVTNPGTFGSVIGYPIINQPQLGILGVGAIKKRPVVINDAIAVRDIVYLTLSYDHRVIDGSMGGQFLQYIAKYLENWDLNRELY